MLRQLPAGAVSDRCFLAIAAGMQIDLDVLLDEIEVLGVSPDRLLIDRGATLIDDEDRENERAGGLGQRIGSTLSGTGAALARKAMRVPSVKRAADVDVLTPYVGDVSRHLNELLNSGVHVIVEGTQGAGLSLHHGFYPYVTARDTTAAGFLSEVGLSPMVVTDVIMVLRTYPIRVAGSSGPMYNELSWDDVRRRARYPQALAEYTTVTGRLRRVAEFDWDLAEHATMLNRPTAIALHGLDYLDHADLGCHSMEALSPTSRSFIDEIESRLGVPARWLFTGPGGHDLIDRHKVPDDPLGKIELSRRR
jgi:adenylosuccinate synthase